MLPTRRHHEPAEEEIRAFREERASGPVRRLLIHSRFVPNLASSDPLRRKRSVELFSREIALASRWGAEAYVIHGGAYSPGARLAEGARLFADGITEALSRAQVPIRILLENVPGGGRRMGASLEELGELVSAIQTRLPASGVGACLDTAHAWAAGYDIALAEGMLRFLSRVHRLLGAERVQAFHVNDTRALLGSHREHHANWGEGFLGSEGIQVLLERPEYELALGILETPPGQDRRNLDYLRSLSKSSKSRS